jgi:CelD/BcsL family acetyltransferase involved in cellulose biosynthesis
MNGPVSWAVFPAADFGALRVRWEQLHAQGPASPLLAFDFVQALLDAFGSGHEVLACMAQDGEPRAMAVLTPTRRGMWETFQPAQAPIGLWLAHPNVDAAAVMPQLFAALPGIAASVGLTQLDPELTPRPSAGATVATLDYIRTARVSIDRSFDDYWQARGKNLRGNLRKQRSRLQAEGVLTELREARDPADMAQAVADYARLEGAGWKAGQGTAVRADDAQGRFYRAMLEAFCARGAGSVYRYYIGGQLAAMDLCVEGGGIIVVLKTAYDERFGAQLSPALLMREEATRLLFERARFERIERIEFYGRVMEWHTRWTDEVRTLYHANFYRWPLAARLHRFIHQLKTGGTPAAVASETPT